MTQPEQSGIRRELVWRQTFKVTVIFTETAEEHAKHDDQSVTIFDAFNAQDCICTCEKLEDVRLVPDGSRS